MTRALLLFTIVAGTLPGAVIRGTVVENYTGKALTRALVIVQPLGGTAGEERTARTSRFGGFEFNVPAGVYLVKASRRGFLPIEYGQKQWNSAGQPITVEENATTFLNIRLPRYGAVSGTVVDENGIGLPDLDVSVYRASKPPELIRQGKTDDRGQYRVGGLTPGKYVVRTNGGQYEDGSYLPTYSRETGRYDHAQISEVFLEQQTEHIDVRPLPGRTYSLSVAVATDPEAPVTITVASEAGRRTVKENAHTFTGLGPGDYEVYAESLPGSPPQGAYQRVQIPGVQSVTLIAEPPIGISVLSDSADKGEFWVRHKDFAGVGETRSIAAKGAALPPGRWELLLRPPAGYHVGSVSGVSVYRRGRADGWNEFLIRRGASTLFRLVGGDGSVSGVVKDGAYAPVYLEGVYNRPMF